MKESRHMESKYCAARVLELLALGFSVWASWSRVLLKGVFRTHVAPTPEGRRRVLMIFCVLASGDNLFLKRDRQTCQRRPTLLSLSSRLRKTSEPPPPVVQ